MKNNTKISERDYIEDAQKIYEKIKNIVPRIETKEPRIDEVNKKKGLS